MPSAVPSCQVHDEAIWETKSMVHGLKTIREIIKGSELRMEKVAQEFPEYQSPLLIPGFGPMVSESVMITDAIVLICRQPHISY
jgi:hypothetical protein